MKKLLSILIMLVMTISFMAGCASKLSEDNGTNQEVMVVDKEKKEIRILTEVNGKYFTESTRHGVVFKDGKNGEKSILRSFVDEKKFYEAMMSLGAKPGNNLTAEDMKTGTKTIEGSKVNVFVTWDGFGKEIPFADIIKSSDPRPIDIRFGGNIERANKNNTGCILCLDSCPTGITSNAAYPAGWHDMMKKVTFNANEEVLPKDGTKVTIIFRLAE
ncbi:hypothetical protein ABG79_00795 [Caloramator mitchellensis]|uniref:4Fe-4S ferredoxin-type domain-containing protein n=1 Tax=Caloramator mitchellensis TaxID=908809 RepID=A0A0R3JVA4_CALMK|nr:YdjY domain-containing protein [Caloramator mitchellensis]KRQ87457.1 hypothetical protein ABG79_00795 [Caloramator mitchellensis]